MHKGLSNDTNLPADLVAVPAAQQTMANRKPVDMRTFVMWHNAAMTLLSLWMTIETIRWVKNPPPLPYTAGDLSFINQMRNLHMQ